MREKIVIVDDEETNLKLLTQWLIPLGYDIELASNWKEADIGISSVHHSSRNGESLTDLENAK